MSLSWQARARLLRLAGISDELLTTARSLRGVDDEAALSQQLTDLMDEVHALLDEDDPALAEEFERIVRGSNTVPAELRAAALCGWLKAELAAETLAEQRDVETSSSRRKQTLGFKIRSPIVREAPPESSDSPEQ